MNLKSARVFFRMISDLSAAFLAVSIDIQIEQTIFIRNNNTELIYIR
jgi:hypothetical protein